jgi:hypothetical protein
VFDRTDGKAAIEATLSVKTQEVQALSDEELMALIAKQQAASAAKEKDEERGTLQ